MLIHKIQNKHNRVKQKTTAARRVPHTNDMVKECSSHISITLFFVQFHSVVSIEHIKLYW